MSCCVKKAIANEKVESVGAASAYTSPLKKNASHFSYTAL
jgi:hypothetical protein